MPGSVFMHGGSQFPQGASVIFPSFLVDALFPWIIDVIIDFPLADPIMHSIQFSLICSCRGYTILVCMGGGSFHVGVGVANCHRAP